MMKNNFALSTESTSNKIYNKFGNLIKAMVNKIVKSG